MIRVTALKAPNVIAPPACCVMPCHAAISANTTANVMPNERLDGKGPDIVILWFPQALSLLHHAALYQSTWRLHHALFNFPTNSPPPLHPCSTLSPPPPQPLRFPPP